jgi:CheY-like chemotaxis protein
MNARDAMPEGGQITISAAETSIDAAFVRDHGFGVAGPYACLAVEDTGSGMVEEVRKRIFEPFFTTKAAGQGAGFGLAIVHDIVEDHHGYITVASSPAKGAKFVIYLPLLAQELTGVNRPPAVPVWTGRATVIVAEDDAATRHHTSSVLEEFGCTVIEAATGDDAVQQFSRNKDDVRLVIADIIMPKMSGREVLGAIRRMRPDTRFLFTGRYSKDLLVATGILDGDQPYLQKPASRAALVERIREVLLF